MQTLTEKVLKFDPPGGVFDGTVIRNLFPDHTAGARNALVHRAVQAQEVLRLKPGLYCLSEELRRAHPHPYAVAALLYYPSHVSLESALSYHGLIPEAVFTVTCSTPKRRRDFDTPLGRFSYRTVPFVPTRAGVRLVELGGTPPHSGSRKWAGPHPVRAFVATPLRAIADLVYLRKEVSWPKDGPAFLTDSMRIEPEDLQQIDELEYSEVVGGVKDRRTQRYLQGLRRAFLSPEVQR